MMEDLIYNYESLSINKDWYDNSDAQTDYFEMAYYIEVNIGKWDKPYILAK
jgi:hypothetical protein